MSTNSLQTDPYCTFVQSARERLFALPLLALALSVLPVPSLAARWVEVGNGSVPTDKVLVDTDSIQKTDDITIVDIATTYATPRTNAHNITMDRHVQRTAFKCAERSFIGIMITGYLGDKHVGSGGETADWKDKFIPLPDKPMNNRVFALVCGASSGGGATTMAPKPRFSSGSGFLVDDSGDVLTNAHVINHCKSIIVKAMSSAPVAAMVEAVDPKNDLAILRAAGGSKLGQPVHFRNQSQRGQLGESIGVIGYPLAGILSSEPKATFGQVNSVAGINNDYTLLQISAPVQPGNSGGPVLDASGLVIGVVVSQASPAMATAAGNVPQNVNFAVRGEVAQIFLSAHGIKFSASRRWHTQSTEQIAAMGEQSTVFIACSIE
jgi:S1-C subfamily serine protease